MALQTVKFAKMTIHLVTAFLVFFLSSVTFGVDVVTDSNDTREGRFHYGLRTENLIALGRFLVVIN